MGVLDELRLAYRQGSYLTKLVYFNVAVWILIRLVFVGYALSGMDPSGLLSWLALPASPAILIARPWTVVTYMFLHFELLHVLFNVLWLYWFGRIFLEYHSQQKLLTLYLVGGLAGALTFLLAYNFIPVFRPAIDEVQLLGASASVVAIVCAIAVYVPNHLVHLMFIGPVKIKWIALITVLLYVINLSGNNAGGNFAHLGGALWGWIFMTRLMAGQNLTQFIDRFIYWISQGMKPRRTLKVKYNTPNKDYAYNKEKAMKQEEVNKILDKIGKSGYDSLTAQEREVLFRMGQKK